MKNRGSTPILTNSVGVHPRNIHTKFEANPCSGLRGEVEKLKSSRRQQRQRRQRQRRRRRRTQPDRYSHTHSLSVTKNYHFIIVTLSRPHFNIYDMFYTKESALSFNTRATHFKVTLLQASVVVIRMLYLIIPQFVYIIRIFNFQVDTFVQ